MATKLLLIEDVEDLGRAGDIVNVKPGYARNFLIPQQFAIVADKCALKRQARLQEERQKRAIEDRKESEELATKMEGLTLSTVVKVDHEGHMYGSVSQADILHLLNEQHGIALEKKNIPLKHPIKEVGVFDLNLKLKEGIQVKISLKVIPEEMEGHAAG